MELHLSLTLSHSHAYDAASKTHFPNTNSNKRSFSQLLQHAEGTSSNINGSDVVFPTLSLLPLTPGHSDHHDHDHEHSCNSSTSTITKRGEDDDEEVRVGWPPVYFRRKKLRINEDHVVSRNYVKVKMEGVGIARKVNLSMHHSFHTLNHTLLDMFGKLLTGDHDQRYELVYQDKEGDWLLAQDVSWRSFIECAQRLKLLKIRG